MSARPETELDSVALRAWLQRLADAVEKVHCSARGPQADPSIARELREICETLPIPP